MGNEPSPCMTKRRSCRPEPYASSSRIAARLETSTVSAAPPQAAGAPCFRRPAAASSAGAARQRRSSIGGSGGGLIHPGNVPPVPPTVAAAPPSMPPAPGGPEQTTTNSRARAPAASARSAGPGRLLMNNAPGNLRTLEFSWKSWRSDLARLTLATVSPDSRHLCPPCSALQGLGTPGIVLPDAALADEAEPCLRAILAALSLAVRALSLAETELALALHDVDPEIPPVGGPDRVAQLAEPLARGLDA